MKMAAKNAHQNHPAFIIPEVFEVNTINIYCWVTVSLARQ
jgi:hypothetical protein